MTNQFFSGPEQGDTGASPQATPPQPVEAAAPAAEVPAGATEQAEASEQAEQAEAPGKMAELAGMLNNHKGKLAVGAAAMLGVAIFYKWRESRLAKEDPEEYARLQRLKKAIGDDAEPPDEPNDKGKAE